MASKTAVWNLARFARNNPSLLCRAVNYHGFTRSKVQSLLDSEVTAKKTNWVAVRSYRNISHGEPPTPPFSKAWYAFIAVTLFVILFDWDRFKKPKFPKVDAASTNHVTDTPTDGEVKVGEGEEEGTKKKKRPKEKVGFRDRKVIFI